MINPINFSTYKNIIYFAPNKGKQENTSFSAKFKNNYSDSFLSNIEKMSSEEAYNYLTSLTSDKNQSKVFIEQITKNPRESRKNVLKIYKALGSKENFDKWYFAPEGYMQAFHNYIEEFYNSAKSIEELVSYMPSWGDWKLEQKSWELYGKPNYTVGKLPKEFGDEKTFQELTKKIKETYWTDNRIFGDININGKTFNIQYPTNGVSGKIVAQINDDYILKTSFERKYKADSPYLNMTVDYYLTSNNCANSSEFCYYDDLTSGVLYKKAQIIPLKYKTFGQEYFYNPKTLFDNFDDAKALGIIYTDRGTSNYIQKGNSEISIDTGHSEYMDILKPGLTGYHITLPSNTGFSQMAYNGVLSDISLASE